MGGLEDADADLTPRLRRGTTPWVSILKNSASSQIPSQRVPTGSAAEMARDAYPHLIEPVEPHAHAEAPS